MVYSSDSDSDFFDIDAVVLQCDTLALYIFIFYRDNDLRTSIVLIKENSLTYTKEARSRRYSAETMTDVGYKNTSAQTDSL